MQTHTNTGKYRQNHPFPIIFPWGFIGNGRNLRICKSAPSQTPQLRTLEPGVTQADVNTEPPTARQGQSRLLPHPYFRTPLLLQLSQSALNI